MSSAQREHVWIDEPAGLQALIERLHEQPRFAMDTESNSMHAYFEKVCLVQISIPDLDALIDPLAVDIAPMGPLLADASIEKVLHGADYDVLCLKRGYGFVIENLFDTMLAARVLGWPKYGLAAILEDRFGHRLNKKYQRYDWGLRPIDDNARAYAAEDTRWLLDLRGEQFAELQERERLDEALHAFERQTRVEPRELGFDPAGFWRIKGARDLDPQGQAVLEALYRFRDDVSRALDRPYFRVLGDPVMLHLSRARPDSIDALGKVKGLPRPLLRRRGHELLQAIERGMTAEPPTRPRRGEHRPPKAVTERYELLRSWRKDVAAQRGVEPDIVLAKSSLMALAEADPQTSADLKGIDEIDDWERERYGQALLDALRQG